MNWEDRMLKSSSHAPSKLAKVRLFRDLPEKELQQLERRSVARQYAAGQTILREGEPGLALFLILQGEVRVVQQKDGADRELARIGPGGWFGEMALFHDEAQRNASVIALEPTECFVLMRSYFLEVVHQHPDIAIHLLGVLSRKITDLQHRL
jgi:CRP-like cAMP-binding protein